MDCARVWLGVDKRSHLFVSAESSAVPTTLSSSVTVAKELAANDTLTLKDTAMHDALYSSRDVLTSRRRVHELVAQHSLREL